MTTATKVSLLKASNLLSLIRGVRGRDIIIPLGEIRGSTGLVTTATPADAVWAEVISSSVHYLGSNTADGNTKTATGHFEYTLPENWQIGQTISVSVVVKLKSVTGTGVANNGSDIDVTCFAQSSFAVGSDLCSTAAQTFAALDTVYTKTFVIDTTALAPGQKLNFTVVGRAIENDAGNGTLQVVVEGIKLVVSSPTN